MEQLLTKKEAYLMVGLNGTLKGSAGQKEEKEFNRRCKSEKVGAGRGVRYKMIEIYETPKNVVHGNTGRAPKNKGETSKTSFKFSLAKALSYIGEKNVYLSRSKYLTHLGLNSENLKHIEKMLGKQKYSELNTVDKLVFDEVQNMQLSLNRFWNGAIELLHDDKVDGVKLHRKLFLAHHDESHDEADDILKDSSEMKSLFDIAKDEAKAIIKEKYGKNLFFTLRMTLENKEYANLRETKGKYRPLLINEIDYFYNKYAIEGVYGGTGEDYKAEFFQKFVSHSKEKAKKNLCKHLKLVTGDFLNDVILTEIIDRLFVLMFENDSYKVFKEKYAAMIQEAKEANNNQINEMVDEAMDFLPFNN